MAQVALTSSVQQAGRQAACPGETVVFTCNVPDDVALQWIAGNQIPFTNPISFRPNSQTVKYREEVLLPHLSVPSEILTMFREQGFIHS